MNHVHSFLLLLSLITSSTIYNAQERKVAIEEDSSAPTSASSTPLAAVEEEKRVPPFRKIFEFKRPVQEEGYLIRPSPAENLIMSAGYNHDDKKHYVRIHNITKKCDRILGIYDHEVSDAAWSPDSAFLATLIGEQPYVEQVQKPEAIHYSCKSHLETEESKVKYTYILSSNVCTMEKTPICILLMHNPSDGWPPIGLPVHKSQVLQPDYIAKSSMNNKFAAIYTPAMQSVRIFLPNNQVINHFNITAADLSGPEPIIGDKIGLVGILSKNNGKAVEAFVAFDNKVISGVALAPDLVAAISDKIINIISRSQGKSIASYIHTQPNNPDLVQFNASGKFLAYAAGSTVNILDSRSAQLLQQITRDDGKVHDIFFGNRLIAATSQSIVAFARTQQKKPKKKKQ